MRNGFYKTIIVINNFTANRTSNLSQKAMKQSCISDYYRM
jgi:hypothetical protein